MLPPASRCSPVTCPLVRCARTVLGLSCRWGGLFCGPNPSVTEERFYLSEYSNAERAAGAHLTVLAFAHEAHRERDPLGGKGCGRSGCSSILPQVQLLESACCCCTGQAVASTGRSNSGTYAGMSVDMVKQHQQQQVQAQVFEQRSAQLGAAQLVPVNAACSTNSSSTGRASGSSHGGRQFVSSSHAPDIAAAPAVQAVKR